MSTVRRALITGALVVGTLDLLDAIVFFGVRNRVVPTRILQSIAAGVVGKASFAGGARTAALGLGLHYFIAFCVVLVFLIASRQIPALYERPLLFGPLYGLAVYAVMNYVVLPLSAAGTGKPALAVLLNGLLIHAFGVGLPAALTARAATSRMTGP